MAPLLAAVLLLSLTSGAAALASVYDLLVVGGGSGGIGAAKYAAKFGQRVVIIEKARFGGDCTWSGCVPSKTLLASAKRAHAARTASKFGVSTGDVRVDILGEIARKNLLAFAVQFDWAPSRRAMRFRRIKADRIQLAAHYLHVLVTPQTER